MTDRISVREWRYNYNKGAYDSNDVNTQISAGWYDWFCRDDELVEGTHEAAEVINLITNDYILDNFYLWFKNETPYDVYNSCFNQYYFCPLDGTIRDEQEFYFSTNDDQHFLSPDCYYTLYYVREGSPIQSNSVEDIALWINEYGEKISQ